MSSAQRGMHPGTHLHSPSTAGAPVTQGRHQHLAQSRNAAGQGGAEPRGRPALLLSPGDSGPCEQNSASYAALMVKNLPASAGDMRDACSIPVSGRSPGGGHGNSLQYKSHGQRSLVGYSPCGCKEHDLTERLTLSHFHLDNSDLQLRAPG